MRTFRLNIQAAKASLQHYFESMATNVDNSPYDLDFLKRCALLPNISPSKLLLPALSSVLSAKPSRPFFSPPLAALSRLPTRRLLTRGVSVKDEAIITTDAMKTAMLELGWQTLTDGEVGKNHPTPLVALSM